MLCCRLKKKFTINLDNLHFSKLFLMHMIFYGNGVGVVTISAKQMSRLTVFFHDKDRYEPVIYLS